MHLDQLRGIPEYSPHNWRAQNKYRYRCESDYIYQVTSDIDNHIGHHQYTVSLLWHNVWLLQYLPSSNRPCNTKSVKMIGNSIAYWLDKLDYQMNIPRHVKIILYVIRDELCHQHDKLRLLKDAMHHQEIRRSSPLPTIPLTQERGAESKSMSVVPTSSTTPHALSSHLHPTQARTGTVSTQHVSMNTQLNSHQKMLLDDDVRSHLILPPNPP